jgi:hypothetical protein
MTRLANPIDVFQTQIERLHALLPGVYDGRPDSIHERPDRHAAHP